MKKRPDLLERISELYIGIRVFAAVWALSATIIGAVINA